MTRDREERAPASRTLKTYAFLAQASQGKADLLSGLAPLFRPIAKANSGKRFDAKIVSEAVATIYGFRIHPWALEDFAPRLAEAGVLRRIKTSAVTHDFVFADIAEEFVQLAESDVDAVIGKFIAYAQPILAEHQQVATNADLEQALLSALTSFAFIESLIRPEKPVGPGAKTLSIRGREPREAGGALPDTKAWLEVLCAGFILHVFRSDRPTYDLLTQIVSGALITEVVLEFQAPSVPIDLKQLTVVLDSPFLMSLLDLGTSEAHQFAREVVRQLREHGARIATFRHCGDEIGDNLKAVMGATRDGAGHGTTARRLRTAAFAAYATAVRNDPHGRLINAGVEIVELLATERWFQNFTQDDEDSLAQALGHYENPLARARDAASLAAVVRFRKGQRPRMARIDTCGFVFVTENPRVVTTAKRWLGQRDLYREGEVPPAITDRYLAGLLWALFGGKAGELAPKLLLSNCAAALEPQSDLLQKMHEFLSDVSPEQAEYFTALMTTERAAQHLVEITLGESEFLTRENAEGVLQRLRDTLVERERGEAEAERQLLARQHQEQVARLEQDSEILKDQLRDIEAARMHDAAQKAELSRTVEQLAAQVAEQAKVAAEEQRQRRVKVVARVVVGRRKVHFAFAAAVASAVVVAGVASSAAVLGEWTWLGWAATAVLAFFGFWKIPDLLFGGLITSLDQRRYARLCGEEGIALHDDKFVVDLEAGTVRHR